MENELSVIAPRGVSRSFDPQALVHEWHDHLALLVRSGELSEATAKTYRRGMGKFLDWFAEQDSYASVGPRAVRGWKAAMLAQYAPASVATWYAAVTHFFGWAVAHRGLAYDPTANVKGPKRANSRRHKRAPLGDAEVLRLLKQPDTTTEIGKRDAALLYLMAYTGVRTIEVQRASIGDLQTGGKMKLWLQGKGHDEADEAVYLVKPGVLNAMYEWLAVHPAGEDVSAPLFCSLSNRNHGDPLSTRAIRGLVKGYMRDAGIRDPRKTSHSLRHGLVTNLIKQGVAPTKIMSVTRHKSLDTLLNYAHELDREADPAEAYVSYGEQ